MLSNPSTVHNIVKRNPQLAVDPIAIGTTFFSFWMYSADFF